MTDASVESDYDVQAAPGRPVAEIVAEWLAASQQAAAMAHDVITVCYDEHNGLAYDIYLPPGRPRGAVMFFHGGFWVQGSKEVVAFPLLGFAPANICYVAVTYGLSPRYSLKEMMTNVERAAVSFASRAPSLGIDLEKIALAGHSAGAFLAAALAKSPRQAFQPIGNLLISGLFNLRPVRHLERIRSLKLRQSEAVRHSITGQQLVGKGQSILAVGDRESPGFRRQTDDLYRELLAADASPRYFVMPGDDHFSIARALGDPASTLVAETCRLFEK
jgi:arylformamidase